MQLNSAILKNAVVSSPLLIFISVGFLLEPGDNPLSPAAMQTIINRAIV